MTSHHGFVTLTGCTFVGNSVTEGMGGGIHNDWLDGAALTNCIFWDNVAYEGPQIAITNWEASINSINYCNIQGGAADIYVIDALLDWGEGNITFLHTSVQVDPGHQSFRLVAGTRTVVGFESAAEPDPSAVTGFTTATFVVAPDAEEMVALLEARFPDGTRPVIEIERHDPSDVALLYRIDLRPR